MIIINYKTLPQKIIDIILVNISFSNCEMGLWCYSAVQKSTLLLSQSAFLQPPPGPAKYPYIVETLCTFKIHFIKAACTCCHVIYTDVEKNLCCISFSPRYSSFCQLASLFHSAWHRNIRLIKISPCIRDAVSSVCQSLLIFCESWTSLLDCFWQVLVYSQCHSHFQAKIRNILYTISIPCPLILIESDTGVLEYYSSCTENVAVCLGSLFELYLYFILLFSKSFTVHNMQPPFLSPAHQVNPLPSGDMRLHIQTQVYVSIIAEAHQHSRQQRSPLQRLMWKGPQAENYHAFPLTLPKQIW